jgi:AcrR family transcriptional regulator
VHKASHDFRENLLNLQKTQVNQRKSDRTRDRLKLAAIDALSESGYRDLKVTDVCGKAGVSSGTFYLYFENKTDVTLVLLEEFVAHLDEVLSRKTSTATAFEAIYHANLEWLKSIRLNAGLFRCILQVGDESPELSTLIRQLNGRWYRRIALSVLRRFPADGDVDEETVLLATYGLGSMMDEICRKLVIYPDPDLVSLVNAITPTDEAFAEFLTLIWYRTLYGNSPPQALSGEASRVLASMHLEEKDA